MQRCLFTEDSGFAKPSSPNRQCAGTKNGPVNIGQPLKSTPANTRDFPKVSRSSISWPQWVTLIMVEAGGIEPPSDRGQPRSPTGVVRDLVSNSGLPRTGSLRSSSPRVSASLGKQAATTQPPSCRPFGARWRSSEERDCYLSSQSVVIVGVLLVEPD